MSFMKYSLSATALLVVAVAQLQPFEPGAGSACTRVFYYPWSNVPLYPVDVEGIEKQYNISSLMKVSEDRLLQIVSSKLEPGKFDNNKVRLLVVDRRGNRFFIDRYGGVRRDSGEGALSANQFRKLKEAVFVAIPPKNVAELDPPK